MSPIPENIFSLRTPLLLLLASALGACGGDGGTGATVAEPHTWTAAQSMLTPRAGHTATLLSDGKVLVAGGASSFTSVLASAELYDPTTGTWTETGSMSTPRLGHTATLLPNGDVLVAGGSTTVDEQSPSDSAEIYDPSQGTWSATGSMNSPRTNHAALSLTNGDVLVSSGFDTDAAERYDPSTGTWTTISSPGDQATVGANLMTLLPNGGVLAILSYLPQLYDPSANAWTPTSPIPGVDPESGPFPFNLTSMKDGTVLIAGGIIYPGGTQTDFPPVNTAYLYQPSTDTWNATGNLTTARDAAIARLLQDGTVLVFWRNLRRQQ